MTQYRNLLDRLRWKYPNYAGVWEAALNERGDTWEAEISRHIGIVFGDKENPAWDEAVDGYAEFCTEALRAQVYFERTGHYQASNYDEVAEACYHSADYMQKRYLPGQYLSHFVWPHHCRMLRRFVDEFLPVVAADTRLFYEIGVGCGMYSMQTLAALPSCHGVGYDISRFSTEFTDRIVKAHGLGDRYTVYNDDIIADPIERRADFIINQEVLEHLERPDLFVRGLYEAVRPGGWGYITAAINAAHTDHIYLYRSPDEVRSHVTDAGWTVEDEQVECNNPEKPPKFRPAIAGFFVRRPPQS